MLRVAFLLLVAVGFAAVLVWQAQEIRSKQVRVFNPARLALYDGEKSRRLYLAILGEVFDVTPGGPKYYSKGKGYHHFVGRDASRAFVSGEFEKDLTDNVTDFTEDQCGGLLHWRGFFRNHTEYKRKGVVVGAFYTAEGQPTEELNRVEKMAAAAKTTEQRMREQEAQYPRCNSRWSAEEGGVVWCDNGLYPRKLISQITGQKQTARCACFQEVGWSDIRQVYDKCDPEAHQCQITAPGPAPPFLSRTKKDADPVDGATDTNTGQQAEDGSDHVKVEL